MMRKTVLGGLLMAGMLAVACGASDDDSTTGDDNEVIGTHNDVGATFGLQNKELALTLDDGPGPRTIEVAEWLAKEKIPATFFMVGKNAKANPGAVKRIVDLSNANGGLFIVANHSMTHPLSLPKLGANGALAEIMNADAVLKDSTIASQKAYGSAAFFFRAPGGSFTSLGAANIQRINASGANKYQGPVFWDIGGALANGYAADWECWSKKASIQTCTDGYVRESEARKKGIILAHDIHSKTVDMLTGTGGANGRSFIKDMQAKGYKFVSLRAHETAPAMGLMESSSLERTVVEGDLDEAQ